jgi:hypothetical protein
VKNPNPKPHRQREAWIPRLFASINSPRTRELVPSFASLTCAERIAMAVSVFRRLAEEDPNNGMRPSRKWSLEYFEACAEGAAARRQFLVEEGVFEAGDRLVVPERVQPQMELGNLHASAFPGPFERDIANLARLMFHEYFGVKNLLSFPDASDVVAWIALGFPLARRAVLPRPRLKLSLLLRDYVGQVLSETKRNSGVPLVAIFGPGKGEELVPLLARGLSVLCLDAHDADVIKDLLYDTFEQSLAPEPPEVVVLGEKGDVDLSALSAWKQQGCASTIFVLSNIDAAQEDLVPEPLHGVASVAASIYLLHELRRKEALFANMARISSGSIVVFDGLPSVEGLDNVILPVSDRSDAVITGHDAVVTHLLCLPPEEMEAIARRAVPEIDWKGVVVGPPIPPPLFYKLQGAVIGRRT